MRNEQPKNIKQLIIKALTPKKWETMGNHGQNKSHLESSRVTAAWLYSKAAGEGSREMKEKLNQRTEPKILI